MELGDLIQAVASYSASAETEAVLTIAFQIASEAHRDFQRLDGETYVQHPLAVAAILAEWHAPLPVVAVALLHDILSPEYSHGYNLSDVESMLGTEIFRLLKEVVNLNHFIRDVERDFYSDDKGARFQFYSPSFLEKERDVLVVKIADRLHNLQTISALSPEIQERTANIGFKLLAPLAGRLGMGTAKRLLEDYCFEITNPAYYRMFKRHYAEAKIHQTVEVILEELRQVCNRLPQKTEVRWQTASFYSLRLYQIEQNAKLGKSIHAEPSPFKVVDAGSFIILVPEESDCYQLLGIIHKLYPPIEGQFRDYIGNQKENGYQSLHTKVKHSSGNHLQVTVRTYTMDVIAKYGIAASWWNVPDDRLPLLPKDVKPIDGEMQVFTPQGEIRYLPQGATVLDFAYNIHTDVGHHCASALVNGVQADLNKPLQTGDRIEIIAGGADTSPRLDWLEHVRTPQAITRIRQWLIQNRRKDMVERGRMFLDRELQLLGMDSTDAQVYQLLAKVASREKLAGVEELLASLGVGRHKVPKLVQRLKSMQLKTVRSPNYIEPTIDVHVYTPEAPQLLRAFARCCGPLPPDDIVGYRRKDGIVAIHKQACSQIKELQSKKPEKLLKVEWSSTPREPNYVIVVEAPNRAGLASDISTVVTLLGLDMQSFSACKRADGVTAEVQIHLGKTTSAQRSRVQKALEGISYVNSVELIHSSFLSASTSQSKVSEPTYLPNPYGPRLAGGSRFYGRKVECERISRLLRDQSQSSAVLLWGQKRIGKTSLVLHLHEQGQGDFLSVYLDVQGLKDGNTTLFLHQLMMGISKTLRYNTPEEVQEITAPHLNRLRKDPLAYFDTFMARVQKVAYCYPLVVILDEFQCLCSLREEEVTRSAIFSRLRSYSLHGRGIHFVLSGGGLLSQLTDQYDITSLFNITHDEKLSCLEKEAARRLIKDGLTRVGNISELAIDLLLDLTSGHPFYLQLLCSRLYEQAQEDRTMIDHYFASQIIQEWISTADKSRFQHLWEGHDTPSAHKNKLILSAIAQLETNSHGVEYNHVASAICPTVSEQDLVRSLVDLTGLGVLRQHHSYYSIEVELFVRWLKYHWPLKLALQEARWL